MGPNDQPLNLLARSYFLEQGKSISRLYEILNSNVFVHHLRKWTALALELILYLLFISALILIFMIPTVIEISIHDNTLTMANSDLNAIAWFIRVILMLFSLPIFFFAMLLGRNRKKNNLIHQAFTEVKKMKESFDKAVKELKI